MNGWPRSGIGGTQISVKAGGEELDAERSDEWRVANATSESRENGRSGGDGQDGEPGDRRCVCLDGWLNQDILLVVCQKIDHTEGSGAGGAGLCCDAPRWLVHRVAVGHCDGGAVRLRMLETLRAANERGCLAYQQGEQQHRNGCWRNASRC